MLRSEVYRVTIWDKEANNPYHILNYNDKETAQFVARNMQKHYVDEWDEWGTTMYEVRLQRIQGDE